jgi:hypothetical protein
LLRRREAEAERERWHATSITHTRSKATLLNCADERELERCGSVHYAASDSVHEAGALLQVNAEVVDSSPRSV